MGDFAADTAVEGCDGRYQARLSRDWEIWGPNGGYIAAIALRAAGEATPLARPASFAGHFLNVADFADVELTVVRLRASSRAASLRVTMIQESRPIFEAIVWVIGAEATGLRHDVARMPAVPPPDRLQPIEELLRPEEQAGRFRFWRNLEQRPIDFIPWAERRASTPAWREWYRYRPRARFDDPFVDAARALLLIDTMIWPATCMAYDPQDRGYIAPSLDVTAQFHRPATGSEWLLCDAVAPVAADGLIGGQSRIWSVDGQLVASGSAHLLCRPLPQRAS
jgi:acyl-CoA thioesterase II